MKKTNEKNIHEGHRKRLIDLILNSGIENVSEIQAMEGFLTYIFPRGDVNPLAHRLLDEYGDFSKVIESTVPDLMRVTGLNELSAKKIILFGEYFFYFTSIRMSKKYKITCKSDIVDLVEDTLRFRTTENMLLLAISHGNIISHKRLIKSSSSDSVEMSISDLTTFIGMAKPSSLVIAHCHPYGKAIPSGNDNDGFNMVKNLCETCGINFVDSYIVGDDGVYSQRDERKVRTYYDIEDLKNVFQFA